MQFFGAIVCRAFTTTLLAALATAVLAGPAPRCGTRWSPDADLPTGRLVRAEGSLLPDASACTLELPLADGSSVRLEVEPVSVLAGSLPADLRTYRGRGVDDPATTARLTWTHQGLHAVVFHAGRAEVIEPGEAAGVHRVEALAEVPGPVALAARPEATTSISGLEPRTLRLAVAIGDGWLATNSDALGAVLALVNVVDGLLEREAGVRLLLVERQTALLASPLREGDPPDLAARAQQFLDQRLGAGSYDIGLALAAARGSMARGSAACGEGRGEAVAGDGASWPQVARVLALQLGARPTAQSCDPAGSGMEPGSGSTLLSAAGRCGSADVAPAPGAYLHGVSIAELRGLLAQGACGFPSTTPNRPPRIGVAPRHTIPALTPFVLQAAADDPDGDALSATWDEADQGALVRSLPPAREATRTIPGLDDLLANASSPWERLPEGGRDLTFRLTARDGRGGVAQADQRLRVAPGSGPFRVLEPSGTSSWTSDGRAIVRWDVAGTTRAPIACERVHLHLSTDGGHTWPIVLAASTPNDGEAEVEVPALSSRTARIKVEAAGNVFFAISEADFRIDPKTEPDGEPETAPDIAVRPAGDPAWLWIQDSGARESDGALLFRIELSPAQSVPVSVGVNTVDGTATAGLDYTAFAATLTLPPGTTSLTFAVPVLQDALHEGDETLQVLLHDTVGATLLTSAATGTIADDDAEPVLSVTDVRLEEPAAGTAAATFTVALDGPDSQLPVIVEYRTSDGTATAPGDYQPASGSLTFAPGVHQRTVAVTVNADAAVEGPETFRLSIGPADGSGQAGALIGDVEGLATIGPIPPGDLFVTNASVPEDHGVVAFNVLLAAPRAQPVTVALATQDVTAIAPFDYQARSGVLTFAPGVTRLPVMLRLKADSDPEADETLRLVLSGPTGGATLADPAGLGTILDDDDVLSVSIAPVTEPASGVAYATVTLSLQAPLAHPASLDYATADSAPPTCDTATPGADYVPTSGTLTFPAGSTTQQFTVAVLGDDVHECTERIGLSFSNLQGVRTWPGNTDVIWIQDDDPLPVLSVSDAWLAEPASGTAPAIFHLHLSRSSSSEVAVPWATADGSATAPGDYVAGSGTLTFPAGSVDHVIDVLVAADAEAEGTEAFHLRLGEPYGIDGAELGDGEALGTIGPVPSGDLFVGDAAITEGDYGQRSLAFPVWLGSPTATAVTVAFATGGGTATPGVDYQPVSGVLTFAPGQSSGIVVVPVVGDWDVEADETLVLTLSGPTGGVTLARPAGLGTVLDDDLQLWPEYPSVHEGAPGPLLALSLSAPAPRLIRVAWATADGTAHAGEDYVAASGVVTFLPGDITRHVPLQILDDGLHESYESFQVDFLPDGQLPPSSTSVGILDDDASPTISISDTWVEEPASGSTTALFHVSLSAASSVTAEVSWRTVNGSATAGVDYQGSDTQLLSFAPGETHKVIEVPVLADAVPEGPETFGIELATPFHASLGDEGAIGHIGLLPNGNIFASDASLHEDSEGHPEMLFSVGLATPAAAAVTVAYTTAEGTAAAGGDYTPVAGTLSFAPGEQWKTVAVPIAGDTVPEPTETFDLRLSNPSGAAIARGSATGSILDDDLRLSLGAYNVTEGDPDATAAIIHFGFSVPCGFPVEVPWTTADGSALQGSDYLGAAGVLTFLPGETAKTVSVPIVDDLIPEDAEYFTVIATAPDGRNQSIALSIWDDDGGPPEASIADAWVAEPSAGVANAVFRVRLDRPATSGYSIDWSTSDGTATAPADYVPASGHLYIPEGEVEQTITVLVEADGVAEGPETFYVELAGAGDARAVGTIGPPPAGDLLVSDATRPEGNSGNAPLVFSISLQTASATPVMVNYATGGGTATPGADYLPASGTLTFAPGDLTRTVRVAVVGDTTVEADETFLLTLSNPVGASLGRAVAIGTLQDDDLSITGSGSVLEGDSGITPGQVTFSLSAPAPQPVSLAWATADDPGSGSASAGEDYLPASGVLSFQPGEVSRSVTILVLGDTIAEGGEWVGLQLSSPVHVYLGSASLWIQDDDPAPVVAIDDAWVEEPVVGTRSAVFHVTLSAPTERDTHVSWTTADGSAVAPGDYEPAPDYSSFYFAPGETTRTISVPVKADGIPEGPETFSVRLTGSSATLGDAEGVATIGPAPVGDIFVSDAAIAEGDSGSRTMGFSVWLAAARAQPVTIDYATGGGTATPGSDYEPAAGTLTFPPGQTNKVITVSVLGDALPEAAETLNLTLTNPSAGVALVRPGGQGVIHDDDIRLLGADVSSYVLVNEGDSGPTPAVVTFRLSSAAPAPIRVPWSIEPGLAEAGSDYLAASGLLTFQTGEIERTVSVAVLGDTLPENDEDLYVVARPGEDLASEGAVSNTVYIVDDDALPTVSVADVWTGQAAGSATTITFHLRLSAPSWAQPAVAYRTQDGTALALRDYQPAEGYLSFGPGEVDKTISIDLIAGAGATSPQTFSLVVSPDAGLQVGDREAVATIGLLPAPGLIVHDATALESEPGAPRLAFSITLPAPESVPVNVDFATQDGSAVAGIDYVATSGTVTFAPGATVQVVEVPLLRDPAPEPSKTMTLQLSQPSSGTIVRPSAVGDILDVEPPALVALDNSVTESNGAGQVVWCSVLGSGFSQPHPPVVVSWWTEDETASSGSDYVAASGTLTIPATEIGASFQVPILGDLAHEEPERFRIRLGSPVGAVIRSGVAEVSIFDDDPAPQVSLVDATTLEGGAAPIDAVLSAASGLPVTLTYTTRDGSATAPADYLARQGVLTFSPGETRKTIEVPTVADPVAELAETLHVEAVGAGGATITGGAATITILDPHVPADFDGDGRSDVTVYRAGAWLFFDRSTGVYTHGVFTGQPGNCIPAPADYDGDGRADLVQFCADRFHFYDPAGHLTKTIVTGGDGTDRPVPADYDGDGRADLTVFRHGAWLTFDTATGGLVHGVWTGEPAPFVGRRSVPVAADFDGDGRADFSVYAGGAWHFYNPDGSYRRGIWTGAIAGDLAVPGDYDGDGIADAVVWRAGAWIWFDRDTGLYDAARSVWTGAPPNFTPGTPVPAPLDVDGDGRLDLAVYSGGPWHFFQRDGSYAGGVWCGDVAGDRPISARQLP